MLLKIECFIEVPEGTSLRSVENEISIWIETMCDQQKDWLSRNDTTVEEHLCNSVARNRRPSSTQNAGPKRRFLKGK
jgi:hypothetical protein